MKRIFIITVILTIIIGTVCIIKANQQDLKPFKCSHEYSYFKSDEVFVITQTPALNECEE